MSQKLLARFAGVTLTGATLPGLVLAGGRWIAAFQANVTHLHRIRLEEQRADEDSTA